MKELTLTKEQAIAKWKQTQYGNNQMNSIKFVNSKLDNDGNLNKDYGKIFAISFDPNGQTIQEFSGEFFPIKTRKIITTSAIDDNGKPMYRIAEVGIGSPITIKQDGKVIYEGEWKEVKDQYGLKYNLAAYLYWKDKVYRWKLGPSQVSSWFAIQNEIRLAGLPRNVKIKGMKEEKSGTIFFHVLEFELGAEFDVNKALELLDLVPSGRKQEEPKEDFEDVLDPITGLPF